MYNIRAKNSVVFPPHHDLYKGVEGRFGGPAK